MAKAFNLTAQINLAGPSNLKPVIAEIRRELGTVSADVKVNIDARSARSVDTITAKLRTMNSVLVQSKQNADSLNASFRSLSASLSVTQSDTSKAAGSINKTAQSAVSAAKSVKQAGTAMEEFGKQSFLAIKRFAAFSFVTSGIFALTNAITGGFRAFINFDKELVKLQQVTGKGATGIASLEKEITRLATTLGVSSESLMTVASTLAQAGLSAEETRTALEALAKTELAPSFDNLTDTTEGAIAAIRQFGLEAGQLESALGSINAVAAAFAVESKDIISAIQRTGGVFATASKGVSQGTDALNEFIAIFTSVRQTTRESAETIATGLRTIFTRIQRASTIQQLKEFGVVLTDLEGKFVGPFEAIKRLSEGLSRLDPRDLRFSQIVEELGGFRQIGKVIPLIQQFATAQEALKVAQKGQGSLTEAQVIAQQSLANQLAKVREQFLALIRDVGKSTVFQGLFKVVTGLASGLISLAGAFKPILPILAVMGAIKGVSAITQFATGFFGGMGKGGGAKSVGQNAGESLSGAKEKERAEATNRASQAITENTGAIRTLTTAINSLTTRVDANTNAINARGSSGLSGGGKVLGFNKGGLVPGYGGGDRVPALLEGGEVVINKKAVKKYGAGNLVRMNRYGFGGKVSDLATMYPSIAKTTNYNEYKNKRIKDNSKFIKVEPTIEDRIAFREKYKGRPYEKFEEFVADKYNLGRPAKGFQFLDYPSQRSEAKFMKLGAVYRDGDGRGNNEETIAAKNFLFENSLSSNNKPNTTVKTLNTIALASKPAKVYWGDPEDFFKSISRINLANERFPSGAYASGGKIQNFRKGSRVGLSPLSTNDQGVAIRKVGILDSDIIGEPENADKVKTGIKTLGSKNIAEYTRQLAELALRSQQAKKTKRFRVIAGAPGAGKTSLATGEGSKDEASLRKTIRSFIVTPEDINDVDEIVAITSTVTDKKLDAYLRKASRVYALSSDTPEEQALITSNKQERQITGKGAFEGNKNAISASTDFAMDTVRLMEENPTGTMVLGRKRDSQGNLTRNLRVKKDSELPEIISGKGKAVAQGFFQGTRGHAGLFHYAYQKLLEKNPDAKMEDVIMQIADDMPIVAGKEGLDHAMRGLIFPADFRFLLGKINFKGATVVKGTGKSLTSGSPVELPVGSGGRRRFLSLKGANAFMSDKDQAIQEKYISAGMNPVNIPRIDDISGTMVRDLLFAGKYDELAKFVEPEVLSILVGNQSQLKNRSIVGPIIVDQAQAAANARAQIINDQITEILRTAPGGPYGNISKKLRETRPDIANKITKMRMNREKIKEDAVGLNAYSIMRSLASEYPETYGLDIARRATVPSSLITADEAKSQLGDRVSKSILGDMAPPTLSPILSAIQSTVPTKAEVSAKADDLPPAAKVLQALGIPNMKTSKKNSDAEIYIRGRRKDAALSPEQQAIVDKINELYHKKMGRKQAAAKASDTRRENLGLSFAGVGLLGSPFDKKSVVISSNKLSRDVSVNVVGGIMDAEAGAAVASRFGQVSDIIQSAASAAGDIYSRRNNITDQAAVATQSAPNINTNSSIQGGLLEEVIKQLGGPGALKGRGMDFPQGLQGAAKFFRDKSGNPIPQDIPTDAKRTLGGPSTIKDNIVTYLKNVMGYNSGGIVKKFMAGGKADARPFGSGSFKFPKRISNAYFKDFDEREARSKSDEVWGGALDKRVPIDIGRVAEEFDKEPLNRPRFLSSFTRKVETSQLYQQLAQFAKFIGLPKENLAVAIPQNVDFVHNLGDLMSSALGQFDRTSMGARGMEKNTELTMEAAGFSAGQQQDLYGYHKLLEEKKKELDKIVKTPVRTFDDGSFSYDQDAFRKVAAEIDTIRNNISKLGKQKSEAQRKAADMMQAQASQTGRGTVTLATKRLFRTGSDGAQGSIFYHELTHQLFQGLRTKSAESFQKYKERVNQLFSTDNDQLADAFDSLNSGYNSADVVYGYRYKTNTLNQIIRNNNKEKIKPPGVESALDMWAKSSNIKKARDFRPLNEPFNKILLDNSIQQSFIDRMEDSGKEEFLTTLVENAGKLDNVLQSALDSTLDELLGGAGITRQKYASGGTIAARVSNGEAFVPPKLARRIGYSKLDKLNKADHNGMSFSGGGISVFKGPGSGTSDSISTSLPVGGYVIREKATKALGLYKNGGSVGVRRFVDGGEIDIGEQGRKLQEQKFRLQSKEAQRAKLVAKQDAATTTEEKEKIGQEIAKITGEMTELNTEIAKVEEEFGTLAESAARFSKDLVDDSTELKGRVRKYLEALSPGKVFSDQTVDRVTQEVLRTGGKAKTDIGTVDLTDKDSQNNINSVKANQDNLRRVSDDRQRKFGDIFSLSGSKRDAILELNRDIENVPASDFIAQKQSQLAEETKRKESLEAKRSEAKGSEKALLQDQIRASEAKIATLNEAIDGVKQAYNNAGEAVKTATENEQKAENEVAEAYQEMIEALRQKMAASDAFINFDELTPEKQAAVVDSAVKSGKVTAKGGDTLESPEITAAYDRMKKAKEAAEKAASEKQEAEAKKEKSNPTPPPTPESVEADAKKKRESASAFLDYKARKEGLSASGYRFQLAQKLGQKAYETTDLYKGRAEEMKYELAGKKDTFATIGASIREAKEKGDVGAENLAIARLNQEAEGLTKEMLALKPTLGDTPEKMKELTKQTQAIAQQLANGDLAGAQEALVKALGDAPEGAEAMSIAMKQLAKELGVSEDILKEEFESGKGAQRVKEQKFIASREGQRFGALASLAPGMVEGFSKSKLGGALGKGADFISGKGGMLSQGFAKMGGIAGLGGGAAVLADQLQQNLPKSYTSDPNTAGALGALGGAGSGAASGAILGGQIAGPVGALVAGVGGAIIGGIQGFFNAKNQQILTNALENIAKSTGELNIAFKKLEASTNAINLANAEKSFGDVLGAQKDIREMALRPSVFTGNDIGSMAAYTAGGAATGAGIGAYIGYTLGGVGGAAAGTAALPGAGTAAGAAAGSVGGAALGAGIGSVVGGGIGAAYGYFNRPSIAQQKEALSATVGQASANQEAATKLAEENLKLLSTEDIDKAFRTSNPIVEEYRKSLIAAAKAQGIVNQAELEKISADAESTAVLDAYMKMRKESGATELQIGKELETEAGRKAAREAGNKALEANKALLEKQTLLARATKEVAVATENLLDVYRRVDAYAQRYGSKLDQFMSDLDSSISGLGGDTGMGQVNRQNEQVLTNLSGYSMQEVQAAAGSVSGVLGNTPEAKELANTATASKVLQDQLPGLLRNAKTPDARDEALKIVRGQFEQQGLSSRAIDQVMEEVSRTVNNNKNKNEGTLLDELDKVLSDFSKTAQKGSETLAGLSKKYNDTLQAARDALNKYNKALLESNRYIRQANQIRLTSEIDLAKTLGKSLSLDQLNAPANAEIGSLTKGLVDTGFLDNQQAMDPSAIGKAIADANKDNIDRRQLETDLRDSSNINTDKDTREKLNREILDNTKAMNDNNRAIEEGRAALEKMASSSEKASNALAKIQELQRITEAGRASIRNVLTSDPQQLAELNRGLDAYTKTISGKATDREKNSFRFRQRAFSGFDIVKNLMPDSMAKKIEARMLKTMLPQEALAKEIQGATGPDGQKLTLKDLIDNAISGEDPVQQKYINAYLEATNEQIKANKALAKLEQDRANMIAESMLNLEEFLSIKFPGLLTQAVVDAKNDVGAKPLPDVNAQQPQPVGAAAPPPPGAPAAAAADAAAAPQPPVGATPPAAGAAPTTPAAAAAAATAAGATVPPVTVSGTGLTEKAREREAAVSRLSELKRRGDAANRMYALNSEFHDIGEKAGVAREDFNNDGTITYEDRINKAKAMGKNDVADKLQAKYNEISAVREANFDDWDWDIIDKAQKDLAKAMEDTTKAFDSDQAKAIAVSVSKINELEDQKNERKDIEKQMTDMMANSPRNFWNRKFSKIEDQQKYEKLSKRRQELSKDPNREVKLAEELEKEKAKLAGLVSAPTQQEAAVAAAEAQKQAKAQAEAKKAEDKAKTDSVLKRKQEIDQRRQRLVEMGQSGRASVDSVTGVAMPQTTTYTSKKTEAESVVKPETAAAKQQSASSADRAKELRKIKNQRVAAMKRKAAGMDLAKQAKDVRFFEDYGLKFTDDDMSNADIANYAKYNTEDTINEETGEYDRKKFSTPIQNFADYTEKTYGKDLGRITELKAQGEDEEAEKITQELKDKLGQDAKFQELSKAAKNDLAQQYKTQSEADEIISSADKVLSSTEYPEIMAKKRERELRNKGKARTDYKKPVRLPEALEKERSDLNKEVAPYWQRRGDARRAKKAADEEAAKAAEAYALSQNYTQEEKEAGLDGSPLPEVDNDPAKKASLLLERMQQRQELTKQREARIADAKAKKDEADKKATEASATYERANSSEAFKQFYTDDWESRDKDLTKREEAETKRIRSEKSAGRDAKEEKEYQDLLANKPISSYDMGRKEKQTAYTSSQKAKREAYLSNFRPEVRERMMTKKEKAERDSQIAQAEEAKKQAEIKAKEQQASSPQVSSNQKPVELPADVNLTADRKAFEEERKAQEDKKNEAWLGLVTANREAMDANDEYNEAQQYTQEEQDRGLHFGHIIKTGETEEQAKAERDRLQKQRDARIAESRKKKEDADKKAADARANYDSADQSQQQWNTDNAKREESLKQREEAERKRKQLERDRELVATGQFGVLDRFGASNAMYGHEGNTSYMKLANEDKALKEKIARGETLTPEEQAKHDTYRRKEKEYYDNRRAQAQANVEAHGGLPAGYAPQQTNRPGVPGSVAGGVPPAPPSMPGVSSAGPVASPLPAVRPPDFVPGASSPTTASSQPSAATAQLLTLNPDSLKALESFNNNFNSYVTRLEGLTFAPVEHKVEVNVSPIQVQITGAAAMEGLSKEMQAVAEKLIVSEIAGIENEIKRSINPPGFRDRSTRGTKAEEK